MNGETNPRNTRCKNPMINGLSPNTALPIKVKMVKLCKIIFKRNAVIDKKIIILTGNTTTLNSFMIGRDEIANKNAVAKTKTLPAIAMIRKTVLGSCHRKDRNSDGNIEAMIRIENQWKLCWFNFEIFGKSL
jgi:hypothetical protein